MSSVSSLGSSKYLQRHTDTHTHNACVKAPGMVGKHCRTARTAQERQHLHGSVSNQTGTIFVVLSLFLSTQEIKCHAILPFCAGHLEGSLSLECSLSGNVNRVSFLNKFYLFQEITSMV